MQDETGPPPPAVRYLCLVCGRQKTTEGPVPLGWSLPPGAGLPSSIDPARVSCTLRGYCSRACELLAGVGR